MPRSLDKQLRDTYFSLRIGVAVIGILFPFLLWVGGKFHGLSLRPSMSAYYYASVSHPNPCEMTDLETAVLPAGSMRNWFVGLLFAVGAMLYVNKGSSDKENIALNIAGLLALGIAIFPMAWECKDHGKFSTHGLCAFLFFASIAFVCVFCADETLRFIPDEKKRNRYRNYYRFLALCMLTSPVMAWVFNAITLQKSLVFYAELLGILSFGIFWLVKSREIAVITKERKSHPELNLLV